MDTYLFTTKTLLVDPELVKGTGKVEHCLTRLYYTTI